MTVKLTLTLAEVCALLGIRQTAFYNLRKRDPTFPKPIKSLSSQKRLLYSSQDVLRWLEKAERG